MGLKEQQDLLVRLYTDAEFSAAFFDDPSAVSADENLSKDEADEIAAVARDEIQFFAASLIWKRLREVEKLLPATCRYLGNDLEPQFREFARNFNPASTKKHLEDAIRFSGFIYDSRSIAPSIKDIARFESARLRHFSHDRRFTVCPLGHDLRPITGLKMTDATSELNKRRSLAVWLKIRGKSRFFFL
jgi:hypothetical protein